MLTQLGGAPYQLVGRLDVVMPYGLCDLQIDCGVLQLQGPAFSDVVRGALDISQPDRLAGVHQEVPGVQVGCRQLENGRRLVGGRW